MSFESPSGVPASQDAGPLTPPPAYPTPEQPGQPYQGAQPYPSAPPYQGAPPYQEAPQYQGAPQYGGAPYPQYAAGPYNGNPMMQAASRPSSGLPIAVMTLSALYVVLCLVEVFALVHRVSLANNLISDPTSVTVDQANSADNLVSGLSVVAIIVFLAVIIVLGIWQRSLRNALAPTGQYQAVLKAARYQVFRAVWLVSILLAIFLRGSQNLDTPQDVISHDHQYMAYYGIRAALGVLLVFLALQLKRASDNAFAQPMLQPGYGAPVYPGS